MVLTLLTDLVLRRANAASKAFHAKHLSLALKSVAFFLKKGKADV